MRVFLPLLLLLCSTWKKLICRCHERCHAQNLAERASIKEQQTTNSEREFALLIEMIVVFSSPLAYIWFWLVLTLAKKPRQWRLCMMNWSYHRSDCLRATMVLEDIQSRPHAFCHADRVDRHHPNFRQFRLIPRETKAFLKAKIGRLSTCIGRTRLRRESQRRSGMFSWRFNGSACWTQFDRIWEYRLFSWIVTYCWLFFRLNSSVTRSRS